MQEFVMWKKFSESLLGLEISEGTGHELDLFGGKCSKSDLGDSLGE